MPSRFWLPLVTIALLVASGCGGDSGDNGGGDGAAESADPPETSEPSPTETVGSPGKGELRALDYRAALFSVDDLAGLFPGQYKTADEGSLAGVALRAQCGEDASGPQALAGRLLELQDGEPSISVTTSVQAFATVEDAEDAFDGAKRVAEACTSYFLEGADAPVQISAQVGEASQIPETGDDSFTLFGLKSDTQLLVGDRFVRSGLFVFDIRFAMAANTAFPDGTPRFVAAEADEKFIAWAEEQS